jgi:hypothetical protein
VLGVLEEVLRQHPVARGGRITGELLILLEDMLGMPPNLEVVRTVGLEGSVGVLLGFAAAAAAAIATALPFHPLEISHRSKTVCEALNCDWSPRTAAAHAVEAIKRGQPNILATRFFERIHVGPLSAVPDLTPSCDGKRQSLRPFVREPASRISPVR